MAVNPCCGGDLQKGTKIVAIIEIVWYIFELLVVLGIIVFFFILGTAAAVKRQESQDSGEPDSQQWGILALGAAVIVLGLALLCFFTILATIFGFVLLTGSNNRHVGKCKAWLIFRITMFVFGLISILFGNIFALWEIFVTPYFIWVTYAFMQEVKNEGSPQGQGVVFSRPVDKV